MNVRWLDRLLGKPTPETERETDKRALRELHTAFNNVQGRTERLERELLRVNDQLRRQRLSR